MSTEIFQQGFKNCVLRVRGNVLENIILKFISLCLFSDFDREFLVFRQVFAAMLSYMHSTCRSERFRQENPIGNFSNSCVLPDFERKNFGPSANIFRQCCQNCLLPVQRIVIREQFFFWSNYKFVNLFRLQLKLFWAWFLKTFGRVVRTAFFQSIFFEEQILSKKIKNFKLFSEFVKEAFGGIMKSCILPVLRIIFEENFDIEEL